MCLCTDICSYTLIRCGYVYPHPHTHMHHMLAHTRAPTSCRVYEFLDQHIEEASPLLDQFPWVLLPQHTRSVIRHAPVDGTDDSVGMHRESRVSLDETRKVRFCGKTPCKVVWRDHSCLLDSIKGGMVTDGTFYVS